MASSSGPTLPTIKKLVSLSGNRCAFPRCSQSLADPAGRTFIGEICHIRAASEAGPRYDPKQSSAERHSFGNLVLMCSSHHTVIDQDPESYPVDRLMEIKRRHEESAGAGPALPDEVLIMAISGSIISAGVAGQMAHSIQNVTNVLPSDRPWTAEALKEQRKIGVETYALLKRALDQALAIASSGQTRPDFRFGLRDESDARKYLMEAYGFGEKQVDAVMGESRPEERSRVFARIEDRRRYQAVTKQYAEFYELLTDNAPMLPPNPYEALETAGLAFRRALVPLEMALYDPYEQGIGHLMPRAYEELIDIKNKLMPDVRSVLRDGLGIPDPSGIR